MHSLMPDGSIVVNFEHASTVLDLLTIFIEAVLDQPHLHETRVVPLACVVIAGARAGTTAVAKPMTS
jgi:hypothetical protein